MKTKNSERGIAMLVALFALLLLSVVGLGMMYSTNMETAINSNFRDKQQATYAAMGGMQEARDRIRPFDPTLAIPTGRIVAPATLPSLTGGIVYIINPKNGETVAPWDYTNKYADTELCHENILSLSTQVGPCSGSASLPDLATYPNWYTTYNDSTVGNFWQRSKPLDYKWIRIQLKKNNNTAVAANGVSTDTNQVCWDGERQLLLPTGYGPSCVRNGSVIAITLTNPGANFTSAPTVTIDAPPSGTQATAHIDFLTGMELTNAAVGSITVDNQGSEYLSLPTVTVAAPTGTPAVNATAHVCSTSIECSTPYIPPGAQVASVTIPSGSGGSKCYLTPPAVLFSGGAGSGASATAALETTTSCIYALSITGTCNAHKNDTLTGVTLDNGSNFSGTLQFDNSGNIVTGYPTIQNSGTGYTSNPTSLGGFSGCGSLTFTVTRGYHVAAPQTITLPTANGGSGYTAAPSVSFGSGVGSSNTLPSGTSTLGPEPMGARKVRTIIVDNGGSGYLAVPTVTISAPGGTGTQATATAVLANNVYRIKTNGIKIDSQGSGYTIEPNVTISGGGGSGATAYATLGRGANYGKIYLLTALAQTATGARTMLQMEVTTALSGFHSTGALTVDGPNPNMQNMPNSTNLQVNGNDQDTCSQGSEPVKPAVGGYDDPNADPPTTSVDQIVDSLPDDRLTNYVGEGNTPSVVNVYESLGETLGTPLGLKRLLDGINNYPHTNVGNTVDFGSVAHPAINYIDGDVTISGGTDGYGILAVTGTLQMNGNFAWHGPILVVGDGKLDFGGGGNGVIYGTVLVAKIWQSPGNHDDAHLLDTLGSPTVNWNGGGGNSIFYDHCWSTNIMSKIPVDSPLGGNPPISLKPLKVLSFRSLPY